MSSWCGSSNNLSEKLIVQTAEGANWQGFKSFTPIVFITQYWSQKNTMHWYFSRIDGAVLLCKLINTHNLQHNSGTVTLPGQVKLLFCIGAWWEGSYLLLFLMVCRMKWLVSSWPWYLLSATDRIRSPNLQRSRGNRRRDWVRSTRYQVALCSL